MKSAGGEGKGSVAANRARRFFLVKVKQIILMKKARQRKAEEKREDRIGDAVRSEIGSTSSAFLFPERRFPN